MARKPSKEKNVGNKKKKNKENEVDVKVYCICRQPERHLSSMIGCDFCEEWYHGSCINLKKDDITKLEKRKWKCPNCEKIPDSQTEKPKNVAVKSKKTKKVISVIEDFLQCPNCDFSTDADFLLKEHQKTDHSLSSSAVVKKTDLNYNCVIPNCAYRFGTVCDLKKHVSDYHEKSEEEMEEIFFIYPMEISMHTSTPPSKFTSARCNPTAIHENYKKKFLLKCFLCKSCGKMCGSKDALDNHILNDCKMVPNKTQKHRVQDRS